MIEPDVDLRSVRVFLVLAEELHFARTAAIVGLTPSRVSQTLRSIERRVGAPLFERTSRRVSLLPLGEQLRHEWSSAYHQLNRALGDARQAASVRPQRIRVGMYSIVSGGPHLMDIIRACGEASPPLSVELVDTGTRDLLACLKAGEVDIVAVRLPLSDPAITIGATLSREPRVLALSKTHPLAFSNHVTLDDLEAHALVHPPSEIPADTVSAFVPRATPAGRPLRTVPVTSFNDALMRVATGELVHATVPSFADTMRHRDIISRPMPELPESVTALAWLAERSPNAVVRHFDRIASKVTREHSL